MSEFKTMLRLQKELNESSFGSFKTNRNMWRWAIIAEIGEAMESTDYKWWKKQDPDYQNLKVELIDILHFALSYILDYNVDTIYDMAEDAFEEGFNLAEEEDIKNILLYMAMNISMPVTFIRYLSLAFYSLGMTKEDVYRDYVTKMKLNEFRQNHGYKDGNYQKIWNGEEDNKVAYRLSENIIRDENFPEKLYEELERYYKKAIKED